MRSSILVRLEGGLGNQLFQYAAGRSVALATGRGLLLDGSAIPHGPTMRRYELGSLAIAGEPAGLLSRFAVRAQVGARLPAAVRRMARAVAPHRWHLLRDTGMALDDRLYSLPGDLVLEGPWQSAAYADRDPAVSAALRQDFALRAPLTGRVAAVAAEIGGCEAVCVHVRRGDYLSTPAITAVHGVLPLDYYSAATERIAAVVGSPTFFVFSDDLPWAKSHLRLPGPTRFVDAAAGEPPTIDQRLMASCRHFVIANSTFSWWAAWLGAASDKIVIAPQRWFAAAPAPAGLIPAGWQQL